ncbi:MAG: hypothetical protein D6725_04240, partial [Planctomycetota bacterium]
MKSNRKNTLCRILCGFAAVCSLAAAPIAVSKVATPEQLVAAAELAIEKASALLEDAGEYAANRKYVKRQAAVLAVVGQALAESGKQWSARGIALREAGLALQKAATHADAKKALALAKDALAGKATGGNAQADWAKLCGMHDMMEHIEVTFTKLRRSLRRSRDPKADAAAATQLAVLGVAMYADTHEVKDPKLVPQWQAMAREYQQALTALAAAFEKGDKAAATKAYEAGYQ